MLKRRDIWHSGKGLLRTRDKMPQIRDVPYYTGWVATLALELQFKLFVLENTADAGQSVSQYMLFIKD